MRFDGLQARVAAVADRRALNSRADYREQLFATLDRLLPDPDHVLSLDIFDTLLLRCDRSELRRFWEIAARMADAARPLCALSQADAFVARTLGTQATYRAGASVGGCREGCLSELHRTASRMLTGSDALHDPFVAAELAYEAEVLSPSALADYAVEFGRRGGRVVLITDMYMREAHVRALLALAGLELGVFAGIFSSADRKVSKASGGIFRIVEAAMACPPGRFVHVGDSLTGDLFQPIANGWRALHLPIADAERLRRRQDHLRVRREIRECAGFTPQVAMPA